MGFSFTIVDSWCQPLSRCTMGTNRRRLGAEFGGTENFLNDLILGNKFHFNAENFWWPFSVIFYVFCLSLLSGIWYIKYMALLNFFTKNLYFRTKNSFITPFLLSSYFHTHPITLLLEILGEPMHRPSPPPRMFEGTVPPVPLSLRPCE